MPALYDVADHPSLTARAAKLAADNADAFDAEVLAAESLLGLTGTLYTDSRHIDQLRLAIVWQINFQLQQGLDPLIQESGASPNSRSSMSFRDRWIDPRALSIVMQVTSTRQSAELGARYADITSVRKA